MPNLRWFISSDQKTLSLGSFDRFFNFDFSAIENISKTCENSIFTVGWVSDKYKKKTDQMKYS